MEAVLTIASNIITIFGALSLIFTTVLLIILIVTAIIGLRTVQKVHKKAEQTIQVVDTIGAIALFPFMSLWKKTKKRNK